MVICLVIQPLLWIIEIYRSHTVELFMCFAVIPIILHGSIELGNVKSKLKLPLSNFPKKGKNTEGVSTQKLNNPKTIFPFQIFF